MSIFYLLPPRPFVGDRFADFLHTLFPGLDWDISERAGLAELLGDAAGRPDVFVVFRDELPHEEAPSRALIDGYGAEPGDEVVEVRPGGRPGEVHTRRWRIDPPARAAC